MRVVTYISGLRQGDGKVLASPKHTLSSSLSMPRSRVEAGKKQAKRSLEYGCSFGRGVPLFLISVNLLLVERGCMEVCL